MGAPEKWDDCEVFVTCCLDDPDNDGDGEGTLLPSDAWPEKSTLFKTFSSGF